MINDAKRARTLAGRIKAIARPELSLGKSLDLTARVLGARDWRTYVAKPIPATRSDIEPRLRTELALVPGVDVNDAIHHLLPPGDDAAPQPSRRRGEADSLVLDIVEGHAESNEYHDGWAATNKQVAARIIAYDLLDRGIVTSLLQIVDTDELPTRAQGGAIVRALAAGGSGPFASDDAEANRILAPLRWSEDWGCYEYRRRAFAMSGLCPGLHQPFDMPDEYNGIVFFMKILEQRDNALPPLNFTEDDIRHDAHGATTLRIPVYDGSDYGRTTQYLGRRGFSGHLGHTRISEIEAHADKIVAMRRARWDARTETDAKVAPVRKAVEAEIAGRSHVALLSVSYDPAISKFGDTFLVRLHGRDDNLAMAILEVKLVVRDGATRASLAPLRKLIKKLDAMEPRADQGLLIDAVLARALDRMGEGFVALAARHVRAGYKPSHFSPTAYGSGKPGVTTAFAVVDGCIVAKVRLANGTTWNNGRITVQGSVLSEGAMAALKGKPLREVIAHPLLDADPTVEKIDMNANGSLLVRVTPVRVSVDQWIAGHRA